jgi:outer membrane protein assembly factor BamB
LSDGQLLWNREVSAKLPELPNQGDISYALAGRTPVADGNRLYVHFGKTGAFAFDHEGQRLWQADVGQELNGYGVAGSPVLYWDLVILNASAESQSLVALDRRTGKEVWKAGGIVQSSNTPLLVDLAPTKTELALAIEAQPQSLLLGLDPATGEQLWSCAVGRMRYMVASPVANDGVVYCIWAPGGGLSAAVRAGGRGDVTKTHLLWQARHGSNVSSPVYHDGYLYFAREDGGIVVCLDARTGNTVYEERLTQGPVGKIYASPVLVDGRIYYVSQTHGTFVVAAKPDFEQLAHNDLGDTSVFNASPAVSNGRLLLRSDRYLYCIGEK